MKQLGSLKDYQHYIGWGVILILIILSSSIVYFEEIEISYNTALFTLSASAQAFAAILVLGLIVIYNHRQFLYKTILETENRIFNYLWETIGWVYPLWDKDLVEEHIDADIDTIEGFAHAYYRKQLEQKFPKVFAGQMNITSSLIKWKKSDDGEKEELDINATILEYKPHIGEYSESNLRKTLEKTMDTEQIENKKQQDRLKAGKILRNRLEQEFESITDDLKIPLIGLIIAISVSLILLAFQGQSYNLIPWIENENTITIIIIIIIGMVSICWMILNMYGIIKRLKSIRGLSLKVLLEETDSQ